jgi:hypothetical protein
VCCSVLQCVAVVAVSCSVLQYIAACLAFVCLGFEETRVNKQKFSKVNLMLNILCNMNIEMNFENSTECLTSQIISKVEFPRNPRKTL